VEEISGSGGVQRGLAPFVRIAEDCSECPRMDFDI